MLTFFLAPFSNSLSIVRCAALTQSQIVRAMCDDLSPGHIIGTLNRICVKVDARLTLLTIYVCGRMKRIFSFFLAKRRSDGEGERDGEKQLF
jgi:hypothetical protein